MALLTADDVLNKKFQATKFREGYDQDEVDDFLDEVVATLRVVQGENEELKAQLQAAQGGAGDQVAGESAEQTADHQQSADQTVSMPPVAASAPEPEPEVEEVVEAEPQVQDVADEQPAEQTTEAEFMAAAQPAQAGGEPESATGMLQLAQRLHDEYVNNGKAEADRILSEARTEGERLVNEAEEQRTRTLNQLEGERSLLERKIDELRVFERDYRTRLKSYLEGLLSDVEGRGSGLSGYGGSGSENELRRP